MSIYRRNASQARKPSVPAPSTLPSTSSPAESQSSVQNARMFDNMDDDDDNYYDDGAVASRNDDSDDTSKDRERGIVVEIRKIKSKKDVLASKKVMRIKFGHDDIPDLEVVEDMYSSVRIADEIKDGDPVRLITLKNGVMVWEIDYEARALMREENEVEKMLDAKLKSKRLTLNADRLLEDVGLPTLRNVFPQIKFKRNGSNLEAENLKTLIQAYREWSIKLHPKLHFQRIVATCEKLGTHRLIANYMDSQREALWNELQDKLSKEAPVAGGVDMSADYLQRYRGAPAKAVVAEGEEEEAELDDGDDGAMVDAFLRRRAERRARAIAAEEGPVDDVFAAMQAAAEDVIDTPAVATAPPAPAEAQLSSVVEVPSATANTTGAAVAVQEAVESPADDVADAAHLFEGWNTQESAESLPASLGEDASYAGNDADMGRETTVESLLGDWDSASLDDGPAVDAVGDSQLEDEASGKRARDDDQESDVEGDANALDVILRKRIRTIADDDDE